MFVKVTNSGGRRYVQLVESFRDDAGRVKKRTVATLGRIEDLASGLESVINGLLRVSGRAELDGGTPTFEFESARALGDVWALQELWQQLEFDDLKQVLRGRHQFDAEALLRVMVFNRLCDPDSKLGALRWLETVAMRDIPESISHQQLLRAMDVLENAQDSVEAALAQLLRPLIDTELSVVFYDITTISVCGETEVDDDLRAFGRSKSGGIDRQFAMGLVQTADGIPIAHEVFEGNVAEGPTLLPMIKRLTQRYPIRRVILIADRGLLSLNNLEALEALRPPSGEPLEYILAVPAARYGDFSQVIDQLPQSSEREWIAESRWQNRRLVVAHDTAMAEKKSGERRRRIAELEQQAQKWAGKLDSQDAGARHRGRKLSDSGAKARFYHAVMDAHLGRVIKVDMKGDLFSYSLDDEQLQRLERIDGKLLLVTNVTDLPATEVVSRYKSLADIERGFRALKSQIEIGPVYHRLPKRIRAHALICFLALVLHRVMRARLRAKGASASPDRALELLRRIQRHKICVNKHHDISGVSATSREQLDLFSALEISRPKAA